MELALVDTSTFVDFLRGSDVGALERLLVESRVVLSDLVRLELLMGLRQSEQKMLADLLSALPLISVTPQITASAGTLLPSIKRTGLNVGIVDYLIVVQAMSQNLSIFSRDKMLLKLARLMDVKIYNDKT